MINLSRRAVLRTSLVLGAGLSMGLSGCGSDDEAQTEARFAVLSDPHIYDTSLGTTGAAFEAYLAGDRKMLAESVEIMEAMVDDFLKVDGLDFVIIPGDLTKDGEKVSHQKMASILGRLASAGIKVYVVPGNHDINNPHAKSFSGSTSQKVATVTPEEFSSIYDNFGYSSALYKDTASLSYIAEVADNLWLIAIDSCKYDNNDTYPETSGEISSDTLAWIIEKLAIAKNSGKKVMAMMHHGITPHFAAQTTFFGEYVVDEYLTVGAALANAGLKLMFTGHFHAQDIVKAEFTNGYIYDVETGSGVTAPSPYRIIDVDIPSETYDIQSFEIHSIPSVEDFDTYKAEFVNEGMLELYTAILPSYGIDPAVAPAAAEIHVAHYKGDEKGYTSLSATTVYIMNSLLASTDANTLSLGYALADFASDNSTADNNVSITL